MQTTMMFLESRYERDFKWRKAWMDLSDNEAVCRKKYPLTTQQEYIQERAQIANLRISELMKVWDLHK